MFHAGSVRSWVVAAVGSVMVAGTGCSMSRVQIRKEGLPAKTRTLFLETHLDKVPAAGPVSAEVRQAWLSDFKQKLEGTGRFEFVAAEPAEDLAWGTRASSPSGACHAKGAAKAKAAGVDGALCAYVTFVLPDSATPCTPTNGVGSGSPLRSYVQIVLMGADNQVLWADDGSSLEEACVVGGAAEAWTAAGAELLMKQSPQLVENLLKKEASLREGK